MTRSLSYEAWKELLRNDCIAMDRLKAFDCLNEAVLRLLYESGLDPTVQALSTDGIPE